MSHKVIYRTDISIDELDSRDIIVLPVSDVNNHAHHSRMVSTVIYVRKYYDENKVEYTFRSQNISPTQRLYIIEKK
jgi:hypothetical protein